MGGRPPNICLVSTPSRWGGPPQHGAHPPPPPVCKSFFFRVVRARIPNPWQNVQYKMGYKMSLPSMSIHAATTMHEIR